jgi:hypothetical protein
MTQLYAQPAAGWYSDPSGQHEARYWDGARWTDRVADRGVENRGPDPSPFDMPAGPVAGDPPVIPDDVPALPMAVDAPFAPAETGMAGAPETQVEAPFVAPFETPSETPVEVPFDASIAAPFEAAAGPAVELAPEPPLDPFAGPSLDPFSDPFGEPAGDPGPAFAWSPQDSAPVAPIAPVDFPELPAATDGPLDPCGMLEPVPELAPEPALAPDQSSLPAEAGIAAFGAPTDAAVPVAPVPPVVVPDTPAPPMPDFATAAPPDPVSVVEAPVAAPSGPEMGWYPDPAGRHEVRYWDGGRWTERVADNGIETTESPAADVLEVAAGAIAGDPTAAAAEADSHLEQLNASWPPDWYPDPTGRHEVRYFDGDTWTEHVANNGLSALDPIADGAPVATDAAALAASIVPPVSTAASPDATTAEAAEKAFAAALAPVQKAEEPPPAEPAQLPVHKDWAARPNALVGWIVVAGAGVLAVGSLGPWAKATAPVVGEVTQSGMSGDGRFMLAVAFLLVVAGIGLILGRFGRVVAFGALSLGTLASIVCAVDMARISNGNYGLLQGTADATAAAGIGLWACLAGAIVCIAGGIVAVTHR